MNRYVLNTIFFVSFFSTLSAMESEKFEFRLATRDDLDSLVYLMDEEAFLEEGIVIPPKKFRAPYLSGAIDKRQLFVISDGAHIVGYKKLFLMKDEHERDEILNQEIRCKGYQAELFYRGSISYKPVEGLEFSESGEKIQFSDNDTYIYNGADFTKRELRGRGLNKALIYAALNFLQTEAEGYAMEHESKTINMIYGITGNNGAFNPGSSEDRTRPIVRTFIPFAQQVAAHCDERLLHVPRVLHERYRAFKPSFAPDSQEFKPLSDEFSVAGAGVVLSFPLEQKDGK